MIGKIDAKTAAKLAAAKQLKAAKIAAEKRQTVKKLKPEATKIAAVMKHPATKIAAKKPQAVKKLPAAKIPAVKNCPAAMKRPAAMKVMKKPVSPKHTFLRWLRTDENGQMKEMYDGKKYVKCWPKSYRAKASDGNYYEWSVRVFICKSKIRELWTSKLLTMPATEEARR